MRLVYLVTHVFVSFENERFVEKIDHGALIKQFLAAQ